MLMSTKVKKHDDTKIFFEIISNHLSKQITNFEQNKICSEEKLHSLFLMAIFLIKNLQILNLKICGFEKTFSRLIKTALFFVHNWTDIYIVDPATRLITEINKIFKNNDRKLENDGLLSILIKIGSLSKNVTKNENIKIDKNEKLGTLDKQSKTPKKLNKYQIVVFGNFLNTQKKIDKFIIDISPLLQTKFEEDSKNGIQFSAKMRFWPLWKKKEFEKMITKSVLKNGKAVLFSSSKQNCEKMAKKITILGHSVIVEPSFENQFFARNEKFFIENMRDKDQRLELFEQLILTAIKMANLFEKDLFVEFWQKLDSIKSQNAMFGIAIVLGQIREPIFYGRMSTVSYLSDEKIWTEAVKIGLMFELF
ncbi:hypothetical protein MHBO_003348 [Bonamia ostreae]|uniref:Uncharacterized protein n=1 Tax=Bonamia ostreae TaxID=126728 RepID=A0ABV2AQ67_9EUKA